MKLLWIEILRDECLLVIRALKRAGLYEHFIKNVSFACHTCGSFVVKTSAFYSTLELLLDLIDHEEIDADFDLDLYDFLHEMQSGLLKVVMLTEEEWIEYYNVGSKKYRFAHERNGDLLTDSEGNPMEYVSDEIAICVDEQCECKRIMKRCNAD